MQVLLEACGEMRLVQHPPLKAEEAWRSISEEIQDQIRLGLGAFIIEPTFPLAHGVPGRVGLLRGYGNAINIEVAVQFILASLEAISS